MFSAKRIQTDLSSCVEILCSNSLPLLRFPTPLDTIPVQGANTVAECTCIRRNFSRIFLLGGSQGAKAARAAVERQSATGQAIACTVKGIALLGVAVSPDGSMFATCGADGHLRVWDLLTGEQSASKPDGHKGDDVRSVAWSPTGLQLVSSADDETAKIWNVDPETMSITGVKLHEGDMFGSTCAVWSPGKGT
ncbi:MAG: hypothetical protein HC767_06500 [Akkermansiaceae bacterium]|nr:hypothetical protein [Akkermansiaceae bacterium]